MAYLLDTNILIQAKNDYYAFDICPGFWDWLRRSNEQGILHSIRPVLEELRVQEDELTAWANEQTPDFFLPLDEAAVAQISRITRWVQSEDYRDDAKREFLATADPLLIAYAAAHDLTVVTHEIHSQGSRRKVKIPTVCRALHISCIRTFQMLSNEDAHFVLG